MLVKFRFDEKTYRMVECDTIIREVKAESLLITCVRGGKVIDNMLATTEPKDGNISSVVVYVMENGKTVDTICFNQPTYRKGQ